MKKSLPLSQVYKFLEPGPVVLVTTSIKGHHNIMAMSWHAMIDFNPPLIGCVISNRNDSFAILKKTNECVINIPTVTLIKKVVGCGNTKGSKVDKFNKFHFTPKHAQTVKAPLIDECYVNLECKVIDKKMVNKYNFFILQVTKAWINSKQKNPKTMHHLGNGLFMISGKTIKLPSKMK